MNENSEYCCVILCKTQSFDIAHAFNSLPNSRATKTFEFFAGTADMIMALRANLLKVSDCLNSVYISKEYVSLSSLHNAS